MCPAQDHFAFLTLPTMSDFCSLPDPDVSASVLVQHSLYCVKSFGTQSE